MTIKERFMFIETKLKYLEKLMYGLFVIVSAQAGVQIL